MAILNRDRLGFMKRVVFDLKKKKNLVKVKEFMKQMSEEKSPGRGPGQCPS